MAPSSPSPSRRPPGAPLDAQTPPSPPPTASSQRWTEPPLPPPPAPLTAFRFHLDYRFAGAFFDDPDRRAIVEYSASLWTRILADRWRPYPAGAVVRTWVQASERYENVALDAPVDGYLVFVQGAPLEGGTKAIGGYVGDWQPPGRFAVDAPDGTAPTYAGYLVFNTAAGRPWFADRTPDTSWDLPTSDGYDMVTTAVHELGHAFAFLRGPYAEAGALDGDTFVGARAQALFGGPVPLDPDSSHLHDDAGRDLPRPWIDQHAMSGRQLVPGVRSLVSTLDAAMLADLGWTVDASRLVRNDDWPARPHPSARPATPRGPQGLWDLQDVRALHRPVIGRPLLLVPSNVPAERSAPQGVAGGVRLPPGASWMVDLGLAATAGTDCVNRYTVVLRVQAPARGVALPLWNTSDENANAAELSIDDTGRLGVDEARGSTPLALGAWHTVALVVDAIDDVASFWVGGQEVARTSAGGLDGRFAAGTPACADGRARIFGGGPARASPGVDVAGVALWDRALDASELATATAAADVVDWARVE